MKAKNRKRTNDNNKFSSHVSPKKQKASDKDSRESNTRSSRTISPRNNTAMPDKFDTRLLPKIVWVMYETEGLWWPGEIINEDKSEIPLKVKCFVGIRPNTVEISDPSSECIVPFHHSLSSTFYGDGIKSSRKKEFLRAFELAQEKDVEDNDGLPSADWAIQTVASPKKQKLQRKSIGMNGSKNDKLIAVGQSNDDKMQDGDATEISKLDTSLKIPGEPVLAHYRKNKLYYPARIDEYREPNKYRITFLDGTHNTCRRDEFYTKYEKKFQTCPLGLFTVDEEDPNYYDSDLHKMVEELAPILCRVASGNESVAWRYKNFIEGGKARQRLASSVSHGPFALSEIGFIAKLLRAMFVPEVAASIDEKINSEDLPSTVTAQIDKNSPFHEFSNELKLRFVHDVLVPETITRLIMDHEEVSYEEAEHMVVHEYEDVGWVETLLSTRESFRTGLQSLREKKKR